MLMKTHAHYPLHNLWEHFPRQVKSPIKARIVPVFCKWMTIPLRLHIFTCHTPGRQQAIRSPSAAAACMNHCSAPGVCTPQTQPTNVTMAAGHKLQLAGLNPKGWDRADTNHCLHRLGQPLPYMKPEAVFVCTQEVTFKCRHTSAHMHKDAKTPNTRRFICRVPPCTAFLVFASRYQKKK